MTAALAIALSTLALLSYLLFIWWLDRYEREPIGYVFATFVWGGIGGVVLAVILSLIGIFMLTPFLGNVSFVTMVVIAPVVEEITKGLFLIVLVLSRHLDNETDGLIYGAAAGLGFAVVENLLYFLNTSTMDELIMVATLRTFGTALMHCISSAILGASVGYAMQRRRVPVKVLVVLGGYVIAVLVHATWNALVIANVIVGGMVAFLMVGVMSCILFGLTQWALYREHEVIKYWLRQEAENGLIPVEHAQIIPYWTKRRRGDWLDPGIPREPYLRAATLLAFRQHQRQYASQQEAARLSKDIERFRDEVRRLKANA